MKLQNKKSPRWILLKIILKEVQNFSNTDKHVLAYHIHHGGGRHGYHSIFVKEQLQY